MTISEMILGAVFISVITAILAFLLEIAHSFIANYGQVHITVNKDKDIEVTGGDPLLATLISKKLFIPSACGGKGTCGYCKVKVTEGGGPLLPTETPYLSKEELEDNVRISCQIKVKNDLRIDIPDELFNVREFRVKVEKIEEPVPLIKVIRFRILEPEEGITFVPGQYVQLEVPKFKLSPGPEFRAYSIASSYLEHSYFDLFIGRVEEGIVSTYVHDYLKEGDELTARGPFGDFRLLLSDREILLIATGTGLAPIMAILSQIEHEHIGRKTTLFFGTKQPVDLLCHDLLRNYDKRLPQFTFIPTLSRTLPEDNWEGEKGRVTNLIEKYVPDNAPVDVHICGAPPMVQSCMELLTAKGIPAERIIYDKFE